MDGRKQARPEPKLIGLSDRQGSSVGRIVLETASIVITMLGFFLALLFI